jgi:hypothetical protein
MFAVVIAVVVQQAINTQRSQKHNTKQTTNYT